MSRLSPLRPWFLLAPLGLLYVAILGRLVQLHAYPSPVADPLAGRLETRSELLADRGRILDRHGFPLAYDRPSFAVEYAYLWEHRRYNPESRVYPASEEQIRAEVAEVAAELSLDPERLEADLRDPELKMKPVIRGLDPFAADRLRGLLDRYPGFGFALREERTREQALGRAAAHVVGVFAELWEEDPATGARRFVTRSSGLEGRHHAALQGRDGRKQSQHIPFGINPARALVEPVPGGDVQTTLDADIQFALARELHRAQEELNPAWAGAIALDPDTGQVLAVHAVPDFDPDAPRVDEETGRDSLGVRGSHHFALANAIEPGSTFKVFVVAEAIERGVIGPEERFPDNGSLYVPGRGKSVGNARLVPNGPKNGQDCLVHSSNVAAVQIGQRLGVDGMRAMLARVGVWDPLDWPGTPLVFSDCPDEGQWQGKRGEAHLLPSLSFGQNLLVNPIRYAGCLAAIANGGFRVDPHLVPGGGGERVRIFEQATTDYVTEALCAMVARRAGGTLPDFGVAWAGKSGTAQVPGKPHLNTVLFAAFGPVPDPEVLVLFVVQHPDTDRVDNPSGTRHAGPYAARVLESALRAQGTLPPVDPRQVEMPQGLASGLDSPSSTGTLSRVTETR